jgi:hypothetical protein
MKGKVMKTNFFRIPVSRWNDEQAAQVMVGAENDLQVIKISGKPEDYYLVPDGKRLTASKRLVVLVPPGEFEEREFALKVGRIGQWGRKDILLVGLASEPIQDSRLRRRMATLASFLRTPHIETSYTLLYRENWLQALRELLNDDDRVICLENHNTTGRLFRQVSLAQTLASKLAIPVCVMQGLRFEVDEGSRWAAVREFLVWVSMLLTLVLFLLLQIRIQQVVPGTLGLMFELISIVIEVLIILRISAIR